MTFVVMIGKLNFLKEIIKKIYANCQSEFYFDYFKATITADHRLTKTLSSYTVKI